MSGDKVEACGQAQAEMPRYQSHKKVWALKIKNIIQAPADYERFNAGGDWYLVPEDRRFAQIVVGHDDYMVRHKPEIGGYYVVYEDGYKSYSPALAFENGYTLIS